MSNYLIIRLIVQQVQGKRAGNPLKVGYHLVIEHGQSAGALLLSNGKARDEVQGNGVAATGVTAHGHLGAWVGQQIGGVVGTFKLVEAAAGIKEVKEGIQTGTLTEAVLIQVVRLLGGRQRTKQWSATAGGQFDGVWGEHLVTEHLRRAVRRLAKILYAYYGGVFRMETGLQRGSDPEEAFSLAAFVEGGTDNLPQEQAFQSLVIAFESFGRECDMYRTVFGAALPNLTKNLLYVRDNVIGDMEKAQLNKEQVDAHLNSHLTGLRINQELVKLGFTIDPNPSAGQKRLHNGQPAVDPGGAPEGGGALTKAQKDRARKKEGRQKKKGRESVAPGTPAGETGTPGAPAETTTTPTTNPGAGPRTAQLLVSGEGFQLFAPEKPLGRDMEVCRAWGKAFFAGGTTADKEPCGWKACFGRCNATGAACVRDHDAPWPAQLKAALKAHSTPEQARRFTA